MNMLAETVTTGGDMVSLGSLGAFLAGVSGLVLTWMKRKDLKEQGMKEQREQSVLLKDPVPTVPIQKVSTPPTFSQHQDLARRVGIIESEAQKHRDYVEGQLRDIRHEQAEQFVKMMNAGESRKDAIMESMNSMVRAFHSRVDQLIDGHRTIKKND